MQTLRNALGSDSEMTSEALRAQKCAAHRNSTSLTTGHTHPDWERPGKRQHLNKNTGGKTPGRPHQQGY